MSSSKRPSIFIGSSTEGLDIACALRFQLAEDALGILWRDVVFGAGEYTLESLVEIAQTCDFAILVVTPDDVVTSRDVVSLIPRDNVMFELGLFMGLLGRDRTFMVVSDIDNVKLPSDLAGVTRVRFRAKDAEVNLAAALGAPAFEIIAAMRRAREPAWPAVERRRSDSGTSSTEPTPNGEREPFSVLSDWTLRSHAVQINDLHVAVGQQQNASVLSNPLLAWLESYYMRGYERALEQVCYAGRLPLPSEPRMQAAIAAIAGAREKIEAVQVQATDLWFTGLDRSVYREANANAIVKDVNVRRLVIEDDRKITDTSARRSVVEFLPSSEMRWITQSEIESNVFSALGKPFSVVNLLICDSSIMTLSSNARRHDGALVVNPLEIQRHSEIFSRMWEVARAT
jgi:hypothetical protein